ncbi:hypothetical protein Aph01nite_44560 [Acrocarpospora phusangensis]|uniref:Uncharacterized protein n=1 Tax=Acrocarpospora phusangensis TaxID=1070424 RepID=A0A919ULG3_9ACTN|nr:hypothetical protein [Acrocarpospora phusangensis]GIH26146.1 hypothetical protein Aph01nite_44560 [Acrocarpospora phusangensis]
MLSRTLVHRGLASALAATVLVVMAAQQPAAASGVTLNASVDCANVNYFGDTRDWYPWALTAAGTAVPNGSLVANPANHAWQFSVAIPSGATSVSISAKCSQGHTYDLTGSMGSVSVPGGISTVTASWRCSTGPVYPGPWVTSCSVQSYSYS